MNGWLSPEGEFIPCAIERHYLAISDIMLKRNSDIETWVHVTPNSVFSELPLTQAQID